VTVEHRLRVFENRVLRKIFGPNRDLYLQELGWGGMDRIELAQDRDRWRALLNAVMNLQGP